MAITPLNKADNLARALGLTAPLFLKREDLHPLGSHKGRSIPLMIEKYAAGGARDFVISSSGNAALAAAISTAQKPELHLTIYVGKNIDKEKLSAILTRLGGEESAGHKVKDHSPASQRVQDDKTNKKQIIVKQVTNPKQAAFLEEKSGRAKNLRQSTDDSALLGYFELAQELSPLNPAAIFIPTSSGTTAQGLYEGFKKLGQKPHIYIVQTTDCHPLVAEIASSLAASRNNKNSRLSLPAGKQGGNDSLATAIVDKVAHRQAQIFKILKDTGGAGFVADNAEILNAIKLTRATEKIDLSPNSALAVAGLAQALKNKNRFSGPVVCLITGK